MLTWSLLKVQVGNGAEKRGLIRAVWESPRAQQLLNTNGLWIFDGNKIAWSIRPNCAINEMIDMDIEKGRESRGSNSHRLQVRQVSQINLFALEAYLNGKSSFGTPVLESISKVPAPNQQMALTMLDFIDHLMRVTPSQTLVAIKRSFFKQTLGEDFKWLGNGVVATKGVYQSLRAGQVQSLAPTASRC